MPQRLLAHRVRIYPDAEQATLLRKTFGCCRLVYNLALEQRSTYGRRGRRISFVSWSAELKALKAEAPFLKEAPHHCLLQALRDLDGAYARFFSGDAGYPKPKRKFDKDSCRFPDPAQFGLARDHIDLPKLGKVRANIHRPIQGQPRSVTVMLEGGHWYASVLVKVRVRPAPERERAEGGYDVGVAQPVVESDGTVHALPRVTPRQQERKRRLQQALSRAQKGSRRRGKVKDKLRRHEARQARRRRDAAHQVSAKLVAKYTHLAAEDLKLRNMTASAKGTVEEPGRNVRQKAGLNRALLDVAPGQLRRLVAYKAGWRGTAFTCVNPARTSQTCSECDRHPADCAETAQVPHGRATRDRFECPFCGFAADADVNAARVIRARGRLHWAAQQVNDPAGPAGAARGALCAPGRESVVGARHGDESGTKIRSGRREPPQPSGLPQAA